MDAKLSENEVIKARSQFLRGTLKKSLADKVTGSIANDDTQICKFHGFYQQDDRDVRQDRKARMLEPAYSFMLRARLPGGVCTPKQWLVIDEIGRNLANGSLRLTTRQTFQYHGILKHNLKPLIQGLNQALIDSIGGCGDVNRNVCCNPNPQISSLHAEIYEWAKKISESLLPNTNAYHEIWLDGKKVEGGESEPIYGETYLPRKFKTAIAIPPHNDVDVYSNDLGFIAVTHGERLLGFNVLVGGGMGSTHGDRSTFPRLADDLGFVKPKDVIAVAQAVVTLQRDHGNRYERKHARLKYTIEEMGIDEFRMKVETQSGVKFTPPRPVCFTDHGDRYGWIEDNNGDWHLTLYIENGRVSDQPHYKLQTALREIAQLHRGDFRVTPNQNLIVANIPASEKPSVEKIIADYGLLTANVSHLRQNSISCVALPTCPLAMAEAERYFPKLLDKIEPLLDQFNLSSSNIVMRMTGCPNGCARPFLAEIGFVGKAPGRYNLYLGGDGTGTRINKLYKENIDEATILTILTELFQQYSSERETHERFGNFVVRKNIVNAVENPALDFHD